MRQSNAGGVGKLLERFAVWTTNWAGSSWAFLIALALTVLWLVTGPICRFSDTWQLTMNTMSSIITLLMVFLLQRSQNKESLVMQIKLNELLAAQRGANKLLINIEDLSEDEVRALHRRYQQLAERRGVGGLPVSARAVEQTLEIGELKGEPGAA